MIEVLNPAAVPHVRDDLGLGACARNGALGGDPANHDQNATRLAATVAPTGIWPTRGFSARGILRAQHRLPRVPRARRSSPAGWRGWAGPGRTRRSRPRRLGRGPHRDEPNLYPVYHRWYFRTGTVGDFEYLVRLLKPRTVDPRVGRRPSTSNGPDANLPAIPELGGILRLGGALRAPLTTLSDADLAEY